MRRASSARAWPCVRRPLGCSAAPPFVCGSQAAPPSACSVSVSPHVRSLTRTHARASPRPMWPFGIAGGRGNRDDHRNLGCAGSAGSGDIGPGLGHIGPGLGHIGPGLVRAGRKRSVGHRRSARRRVRRRRRSRSHARAVGTHRWARPDAPVCSERVTGPAPPTLVSTLTLLSEYRVACRAGRDYSQPSHDADVQQVWDRPHLHQDRPTTADRPAAPR